MDKMTEDNVLEIIAEHCTYLGSCGVWNQFIAHMGEAGWSEDEIDEAREAFGKRVGRDL